MAASYYSMDSISLRNLYFTSFRDGLHTQMGKTECEFLGLMLGDPIHPNVLGRVLFADWLVYLLMKAGEVPLELEPVWEYVVRYLAACMSQIIMAHLIVPWFIQR